VAISKLVDSQLRGYHSKVKWRLPFCIWQ